MSFFRFFGVYRRLFERKCSTIRKQQRKPRKTLPQLEQLESRVVPTAYSWTGGSGVNGNWTTDANWSPNTGYPGQSSSDTVTFNSASYPFSPVLNASESIASITVGSGNTGTVTLSNSNNSTLTLGSGGITFGANAAAGVFQLEVPVVSTGALTVENATLQSSSSMGWFEVDPGANAQFATISIPGANGTINMVAHQIGGTLASTGAMSFGSVNGPATQYDYISAGALNVGTNLQVGATGTASVVYASQMNMSGGTVTVGGTTQIGNTGGENDASTNSLIMSGGSFTSTGRDEYRGCQNRRSISHYGRERGNRHGQLGFRHHGGSLGGLQRNGKHLPRIRLHADCRADCQGRNQRRSWP